MADREHGMWEALRVLEKIHAGESRRSIAQTTGRCRKTIGRYIKAATAPGWVPEEHPPDEALAAEVLARARPGPPPGEAVLSAAITGVGAVKSTATGSTGATTVSSGLAASGGVNSFQVDGGAGMVAGGAVDGGQGSVGMVGGGGVDALAASGDSSTTKMQETRRMQELNQSFNLQYLGLQQNMQSENRQFTTLSNIMKTKHDTAKNAINNVL